jgi:hypothetical protein
MAAQDAVSRLTARVPDAAALGALALVIVVVAGYRVHRARRVR